MKFKSKSVRIVLIICLVCAILIGLVYFVFVRDKSNLGDEVSTKKLDVKESIDNNTENKIINVELKSELVELNKKYKDAVAWLTIDNTIIDYPIFQSADNNRYLRYDRDNVNTNWGEKFLDYRCNLKEMDSVCKNYIIYGHNTTTDDNFTPILKYKDKNYFDKNKIIKLHTLDGNYEFEIFSVYITDKSFFYIDTVFNSIGEYTDFINQISSKSMYETGIKVTDKDNILTLSTCEYSRKDGRFVIHARLIR